MRTLAALALAALCATPALADGKVYVTLPDLSGITGNEAETMLREVVLANVVSSNCAQYGISDAEWSLLTDSADLLARGQLGLSIEAYDTDYYQPAFAALEEDNACTEYGPQVEPVLDRLVELGGSREARPDQDAAYAEEQEREAGWGDGANPPAAAGKTKQK